MQGVPLLEEQVLNKAEEGDLVLQLTPGLPDGVGVPEFQLFLPLVPGLAAEFVFQSHEQGKVREPAAVFFAEGLVSVVGGEPAIGGPEHLQTVVVKQTEVRLLLGDVPADALQVLLRQKALLYQDIQVDEIVVAREGGAGLIGGIAEAGGRQGQDLPIALAGIFQKVYELICLFSHGAHAVAAGQAGDVHQNAAASHVGLPQLYHKVIAPGAVLKPP